MLRLRLRIKTIKIESKWKENQNLTAWDLILYNHNEITNVKISNNLWELQLDPKANCIISRDSEEPAKLIRVSCIAGAAQRPQKYLQSVDVIVLDIICKCIILDRSLSILAVHSSRKLLISIWFCAVSICSMLCALVITHGAKKLPYLSCTAVACL